MFRPNTKSTPRRAARCHDVCPQTEKQMPAAASGRPSSRVCLKIHQFTPTSENKHGPDARPANRPRIPEVAPPETSHRIGVEHANVRKTIRPKNVVNG